MGEDNPIGGAVDYGTAIEILTYDQTWQGIYFLKHAYIDLVAHNGPVSQIWLDRGGRQVGRALSRPQKGVHITPNPMRMSHYGPGNVYLREAYCKAEPDYTLLVDQDGNVPPISLIDNVVESKGSFLQAKETILNGLVRYSNEHQVNDLNPEFYYLALVSKITSGDLANLIYAYWINEQIWVHGKGCDDEGEGRGKKSIYGRLKPNPDYIPSPPYFHMSEPMHEYVHADGSLPNPLP